MSDRQLPGADKYLKHDEPDNRSRATRFVDKINAEVRLSTLLQDEFGIYIPDEIVRSWKTYCPWSFEHPDGGTDKTLRIYPSNSAYCFALHGVLTPVRIVQIQHECGSYKAAHILAEKYGLAQRKPYWERMNELVLEQATRKKNRGPLSYAAEALRQALVQVPGFQWREFDDDVVAEVGRQLERLDDLDDREGAAREWLVEAVASVTQVVKTGKV